MLVKKEHQVCWSISEVSVWCVQQKIMLESESILCIKSNRVCVITKAGDIIFTHLKLCIALVLVRHVRETQLQVGENSTILI